jgi:hypothetical protein
MQGLSERRTVGWTDRSQRNGSSMDQSLTRLGSPRAGATGRASTAQPDAKPGLVRPQRLSVSLALLWTAAMGLSGLWLIGLVTVVRWLL